MYMANIAGENHINNYSIILKKKKPTDGYFSKLKCIKSSKESTCQVTGQKPPDKSHPDKIPQQ